MGRRRAPVVACDDERHALVAWVRARIDQRGLTYAALARSGDIRYHRSSISRALSGRRLPPWPLVESIALRCGADVARARNLWEAADAAARPDHAGCSCRLAPPVGTRDYAEFCRTLRRLVEHHGISQRELVRRDQSGVLARSTVGAILRQERSVSREVALAITRACGVTQRPVTAWGNAWERAARPYREAMEKQRREIAYDRLRPYYGWRT